MPFDQEEKEINANLMDVQDAIYDMGLKYNQVELSSAIHTIQFFIIKRMLQREDPTGYFSDWYDLTRDNT